MIKLIGVSKKFKMGENEVIVLDKMDIHIKQNEFAAIVGPSGSGKSTLMNIIGCLDTPDEGDYFFQGKNISKASDNHLADIRNNKIGFIFQNFNLLPKLNALENVEVPLQYRGLKEQECRKKAINYLAKVGLTGREDHKPNQLSGGQQQRVAIARALVGEPELLLADEPTGALDSITGQEIMELLKGLHSQGHSVLLITHDQKVAEQAERVLQIQDGRICHRNETLSVGV
ncbi:MAG: macrolide ABC transporter ATP-binding protein [Gracilibacter sp. BRH_c7a]|nr:MAG: macrolide ABC transporter ATP-binding protein [Gracilibacter sp. BRH_c7a]